MEIVGGVVGVVLVVFAVVLALFWIVFPWMVYSQLKGMIESQKRLEEMQQLTNYVLEKIERHNSQTATSTLKLAEFFEGRKAVMETGKE